MSLFEIDFAKPKTPKITPTVLFVSLILGLFFTLFFYFLPEILLNPLFGLVLNEYQNEGGFLENSKVYLHL